jgi:arsenite methyltransferase
LDNRIPFGIDDVAQYPLFTKELIALMGELIPRGQHDAVATSVIARARRV